MYTTLKKNINIIRHLVVALSLFAVVGLASPQKAQALSPVLVRNENNLVQVPMVNPEQQLTQLKKKTDIKQVLVINKMPTIQETKSKQKATEQKKAQLKKQISQLKAEVEAKKVALAQKKAAQAQAQAQTVAATAPAVEAAPVAETAPAPEPVVCGENQWLRADNGQCMDKPDADATGGLGGGDEGTVAVVSTDTYSGSSSDNYYEAGQCTWHVKNLRPDLPNSLGNADQWYWNAQALGLATGTEPRVGAAAVRKTGMHVAYVTAVNDDGTITVSEMNYDYTPFNQRIAIKNASDFYYIY